MEQYFNLIIFILPLISVVACLIKTHIDYNEEKALMDVTRQKINDSCNEYLDDLISRYKEMGGNGYIVNKEIKPEKKKTYPTNCKNCGAVLHSNVCEFCGSEYW